MQFWNWFVLANAAMVMAKPCQKHIDISMLPECMQQCMRQETKHFNIDEASPKRACDKMSHKIVKFWKFLRKDLAPCMRNQCDGQGSEIFQDWYYDLCGHEI